jgi:uncharacterized protein (DUF2062 family)
MLLFWENVMRKRSGKSLKFYLRLMRHRGTPAYVGRGVASGLFSAFITPIGQMPLALLLAWPLRGAKGSALLSTWITNPFNMPVIYSIQCYLGSFVIGDPLSYTLIKHLVSDAITNPCFKTSGALGGELILSFFTGGLIFGTVSAVLGYFITATMVRRYRARRLHRKTAKMVCRKTKELKLCD